MKILKFRPINTLVKRIYPEYFQYIGLFIFIILLIVGIFGSPFASRNPLTYFIWTIWWSILPLLILVSARAWCAICPLGTWTDIIGIIKRFKKPKTSKFLLTKGIWIGIILFLIITWLDWGYGITANPRLTSLFFISLLSIATLVSIVYSGRLFCKSICPITPLLRLYSQFSLIEYRGRGIKLKTPFHCPMYISPINIQNNKDCILCFKCLRKKENGEYSLLLRPPGNELFGEVNLSLNEKVFLLILVPLLFLQTFQMSKIYPGVIKKIFLLAPIKSYYLTFTLLFAGLISFFILFYFTVKLTQRVFYKENFEFLYLAVPLVLMAHIFHSIIHLVSDFRERLGLNPLGREWIEIGPYLKSTGIVVLSLGLLTALYMILKIYPSFRKRVLSLAFTGSVFAFYFVLIFMHLGLSHIH